MDAARGRIDVTWTGGWAMSWRWSRLSTLAVLLVLYAAPLSAGDKGLWLSVASMPVPLSGAVPGGVAPEHSIVLPTLSLARAGVERGDPAPGAGVVAIDDASVDPTWTSVGQPPTWTSHGAARPAPIAPRGPPA
jgi:hypothetical protein